MTSLPLWAGNGPGGMAWWAFVAWLAAIGWSDFSSRRIANALIAGGACIAVLLLLTGGGPTAAAWRSLGLGLLLVAALFLPAWLLRYMGAADVKLAAALVLWGGHESLTLMWVMASVMAMVHAVWLLARRRRQAGPDSIVSMRGTAADIVVDAVADATGPTTAAPSRRQIPFGGYLALAGGVLALASLVPR